MREKLPQYGFCIWDNVYYVCLFILNDGFILILHGFKTQFVILSGWVLGYINNVLQFLTIYCEIHILILNTFP